MGGTLESSTEKPPFKWTFGWRVLLVLGSFFSEGPFVYFFGAMLLYVSVASEIPIAPWITVILVLLVIFIVFVLPAAFPKVAILPVWLLNVGVFLYLAGEAVWVQIYPEAMIDSSIGRFPPWLVGIAISTAIFTVVLWRPMKATVGGWYARIRRRVVPA